jgi:uroporphyrinogen decarboxylase
MNNRERFLAFANFEKVDRVPRHAGYVPALKEKLTDYLGKAPNEVFDMDGGIGVGLRPPDDYEAPDYSVYFPEYEIGKDGFTIDENGCGHLNAGFYHFTEYISPLRNATSFEELEKYPYINNETWIDDKMLEGKKKANETDDYAVAFIGHMYENSWQVRGYEPFLMDLLIQREWAEYILDRYFENNLRAAVAAAKAGYDCIRSGDDVANQNAMMFQPELWREVFKSRWAKVYAAAREIKPDIHIWYHSDGNIEAIIDDLIEIGVTILNPVQPECMDPVALRKRYGKNLAFDGCVGTQTTFPFGSTDDMRKTIRGLGEALDAGNGGLMLSPTHILEPEVPCENIVTFFETCDELTF